MWCIFDWSGVEWSALYTYCIYWVNLKPFGRSLFEELTMYNVLQISKPCMAKIMTCTN